MKRRILCCCAIALAVALLWRDGGACTTACLKGNGWLLYARNLDYDVGGGYVLVNKRPIAKMALVMDTAARWKSRYGSVTFNLYGREFPMGGMNEAGLVVENMWLSATEYPKPDSLPAVDNLQWIQYQLDNSATVSEAIEHAAAVRISGFGGASVHYLVADADGDCAVFEYLEGKLVVHTGEDLPVEALTNTIYQTSVDYLGRFDGNEGTAEYLAEGSSLGRFLTASRAVASFAADPPADGIAYAFDVLDEVGSEERTQWKIVYDIPRRQIHFRTMQNRAVRIIDMNELDFDCSSPALGYNLESQESGPVNGRLETYSYDRNRALVMRVFRETEFLKETPQNLLEILAKYPEGLSCVK